MKSEVLFLLFFASIMVHPQQNDLADSLKKYTPGEHELILMPTAYTMDQGSAYFSSYEIAFINLTYALTPTTHIGFFTLFPVVSDFLETITIGGKQNYLRSENLEGAVWASYTVRDNFYTLGNVFSLGKKKANFHIGLGLAGFEDSHIFLILMGGKFDISPKVSGVIEYTNAKEFLDQDFKGLVTFGLKFHTDNTCWEIAGVRPLASTGDILLIPIIKGTIFF